jgi:hypothetical protein
MTDIINEIGLKFYKIYECTKCHMQYHFRLADNDLDTNNTVWCVCCSTKTKFERVIPK